MKERKINWGIIGPGRIAHNFVQGINVLEDANLYAVASRNEKRANDFAGQYKIEKTYNCYEDIIADPKVDAIYIATPHRFHFEQCMMALTYGKPVLCEKPITVNALQLNKLITTAKNNNVFLMEALWTRYLPIYEVVKTWLDEKLIGDIKLLTSTFGFVFERDLSDRKFNRDLAGGALLDLGVYQVSTSQWVMRKNPVSFTANGLLGETNVDEMLAVNLQYDDGAVSQFSCNFLSANENSFIIYGAKGNIKIHNNFWAATKATLYLNDKEMTITKPFKASGFEYQIEEATKCIINKDLESSIMPHSQSLANMKLMDSIRKEIGLKYSFE